jgi:hypothetical protein
VDDPKPPGPQPVLDRSPPETDLDQLPVRHPAVLSIGELPDPSVTWALEAMYFNATRAHVPSVADFVLQHCYVGDYSTTWTLKRLVPPALPTGRPAVTPILSPGSQSPARLAAAAQTSRSAVVSSGSSFSSARTPQ